jgi:hypothetical protein
VLDLLTQPDGERALLDKSRKLAEIGCHSSLRVIMPLSILRMASCSWEVNKNRVLNPELVTAKDEK